MVKKEVKEFEVRCKKCNRKLFIGSPGFNIKNGESKEIKIKCPRCHCINIINCEIEEKIIIKLKE